MGMDVDPHDTGLAGAKLIRGMDTAKNVRDSTEDLHIAIDLAREFSIKLKELHPVAEAHIKHLILTHNLL